MKLTGGTQDVWHARGVHRATESNRVSVGRGAANMDASRRAAPKRHLATDWFSIVSGSSPLVKIFLLECPNLL